MTIAKSSGRTLMRLAKTDETGGEAPASPLFLTLLAYLHHEVRTTGLGLTASGPDSTGYCLPSARRIVNHACMNVERRSQPIKTRRKP